MLKSITARTEPYNTPFLIVCVFLTCLCSLKLRFVISSCINRTMCLLRIRRSIFRARPLCHTVLYAAERSTDTAPHFSPVSKVAVMSSVSLTICSTVLLLGRNPACSRGSSGPKTGSLLAW